MRQVLLISICLLAITACARPRADAQTYEFKTYGPDEFAMDVIPKSTVSIPASAPLRERLQMLADSIYGQGWFVVEEPVSTSAGKRTVIQMIDPVGPPADSPTYTPWYAKFQGTTGSILTSDTIRLTFLPVIGKWLDEVEFLYDGELGQHAEVFVRVMNPATLKAAADERVDAS